MTDYLVYRLHAPETEGMPDEWIDHTEWCETPEELRCPLDRDEALRLIDWDRCPGDSYRIRRLHGLES